MISGDLWSDEDIREALPKQIRIKNDTAIKDIHCGANHSCIQTVDDLYYIFGENKYGECLIDPNIQKIVSKHNLINDYISNENEINFISMGNGQTYIVTEKKFKLDPDDLLELS